jgi:2-polyprenyl-3-methyl-5-hydroxy-6-metoxy-1,4-benzoquinol methylase
MFDFPRAENYIESLYTQERFIYQGDKMHSHHSSHANIEHTHKQSDALMKTLHNLVLTRLHDTELWASHLPRLPKELSLLALLGFTLGGVSFSGFGLDSKLLKFSALGLGFLFILPGLLAGLFAQRKWRYASSIRKQIFDSLALRGNEKILDVGCGSGLLLNAAATRLTSGKATGIDIWAPHSGGGNYALLMRNAQAEGVADKIEFKEADVRKLPFEDESFDVIVSSGALHHISLDRSEHEQAINEMLRVLKPGGKIALMDIEHMIEGYAANMRSKGVASEVYKTAPSPFGFEMSVLVGQKPDTG